MCGRFTRNYTWQNQALYRLTVPAAIPNFQPRYHPYSLFLLGLHLGPQNTSQLSYFCRRGDLGCQRHQDERTVPSTVSAMLSP